MFLRVALSIFVCFASAALAAPPPPAHWTDGYVLTNGIRMHYWRTATARGGKVPLVLAHGSSDDGLCWTNFATELEADFDIVMIDARGHGLSDPPKAGDPVDVQADDLAGLIRELNLEMPIVMGHSMGSFAAAAFGAKYPGMARAIVLEDPNLAGRPTAPANNADPEARRRGVLSRNNLSEAELVAQCIKSNPKWGRAECETWAPSKRRHHPDTALGRGVAARPPMTELFAKITAPTLILKAEAQGDIRAQNESAAAALPKGQIVHIEGAGHNVRRDEKQKTLAALRPFLAKYRSLSRSSTSSRTSE